MFGLATFCKRHAPPPIHKKIGIDKGGRRREWRSINLGGKVTALLSSSPPFHISSPSQKKPDFFSLNEQEEGWLLLVYQIVGRTTKMDRDKKENHKK